MTTCINACRIPDEKDDFNDNMCRKYINYPVLDVYLLQRDVQSPHIALSVNDPRKWMNDCRANVDNLYCYQTFLKCDEETGVGIELCKSSCSPMHLACRKSENETIPNLKKLDISINKRFCAIIESLKTGNILLFEKTMDYFQQDFTNCGIYLL